MRKLVLFLFFLIISCQSETDFEEIYLNKPTMVSIAPDDLSMDALISKWGEEDFGVIVDDVMWYHSELMMLVDSLNIAQVNTNKRKVKLSGPEEHWKINMDTTNSKWRYIYFDGKEFLEKDAITMKELLSNN